VDVRSIRRQDEADGLIDVTNAVKPKRIGGGTNERKIKCP
jgi:hypothetical protein